MPLSAWQEYQILKARDDWYEAAQAQARAAEAKEAVAAATQQRRLLLEAEEASRSVAASQEPVSPLTAYRRGQLPLTALSPEDFLSLGTTAAAPSSKGTSVSRQRVFGPHDESAAFFETQRTRQVPAQVPHPRVDAEAVGKSAVRRVCDRVGSEGSANPLKSRGTAHGGSTTGGGGRSGVGIPTGSRRRLPQFPFEDVSSSRWTSTAVRFRGRQASNTNTSGSHLGETTVASRKDPPSTSPPSDTPAPAQLHHHALLTSNAENTEEQKTETKEERAPLSETAAAALVGMPYRSPDVAWGVPWDSLHPYAHAHATAPLPSAVAPPPTDAEDVGALVQWAETLDAEWIEHV